MYGGKMDDEVSDDVRRLIKREGKFDDIRKKAMANMNSDGFLEQLQLEMKESVEEMMKTFPATWNKDQVKVKIREHLNSINYRRRIEQKIFTEVGFDWVESELSTDVATKTRAAYGLPEKVEPTEEPKQEEMDNGYQDTSKGVITDAQYSEDIKPVVETESMRDDEDEDVDVTG